jgi:RNA polymerase sigma factor (sigma-70 family)
MVTSSADSPARALFERYGRAVRRFLYRMTGDVSQADDLTGEVFLRVVRAGRAYEARGREAAWVFRIARNVWLDARRRARRSVEEAASADLPVPAGQVIEIDLQRGLDALAEDDREVFLLGEVAGLSYVEIADATGATAAAVRSRIYRARQALRARLLPPPRVAVAGVRDRHDD